MELPLQMPRPCSVPPGNSDTGCAHLNSIRQPVFPKLIIFFQVSRPTMLSAAFRWVAMPDNRHTGPHTHTHPASSKSLFALVSSESRVSRHVLLNPMDKFLLPTVFKSNNQKLYHHQWFLLTIIFFSR